MPIDATCQNMVVTLHCETNETDAKRAYGTKLHYRLSRLWCAHRVSHDDRSQQ